jgi:hypothetical protein
MLGIRIPVCLDPDLIGQIQILEKKNDGSSQSIGLQVLAKSLRSVNLDFTATQWIFSFTTADFQTEKSVCAFSNRKKVFLTLSLGFNYCCIGPSRPPSRDTAHSGACSLAF